MRLFNRLYARVEKMESTLVQRIVQVERKVDQRPSNMQQLKPQNKWEHISIINSTSLNADIFETIDLNWILFEFKTNSILVKNKLKNICYKQIVKNYTLTNYFSKFGNKFNVDFKNVLQFDCFILLLKTFLILQNFMKTQKKKT